jgi:hypothetical protein
MSLKLLGGIFLVVILSQGQSAWVSGHRLSELPCVTSLEAAARHTGIRPQYSDALSVARPTPEGGLCHVSRDAGVQ